MSTLAPAALFLLLLTGMPAWAETFKCTVNGQTVYADHPCGSGATVVNTTASSGYGGSSVRNVYTSEMRSKIAQAIAQRDFAHAEALAVSESDWNMIATARREIELDAVEAKARKREARGVNCFSSSNTANGYTSTYTHCK